MKRKSGNAPAYLTTDQVDKLIAAARKGSHGTRDALLVLLMYRHGFRASEAAELEWSQIDLAKGLLQVHRIKNGTPSTHVMRGDEIRALRAWHAKQAPKSPLVFNIGRNMIGKLIAAYGADAGLPPCHPHMLRHACGYALALAGHDTRRIQNWLGHASITNTVIYTAMSPEPFKDFWR